MASIQEGRWFATPGSLLLATRTAVGLAGIATETIGASQDITRLITNGLVHTSYLCRALIKLEPELQRRSRGTTIQGITREDVSSLPIPLPPLPEQRAIAEVLDSIDEAIEATEAVVAATEQLRDALLHRLLTLGVPGWHSEWKDVRGIGAIPATWEVVRLGEVAAVGFSGVDKKTVANEIPVKLCNYTDVFYNRRIRPTMPLMSATATQIECERWTLRGGDVLFTKDSETPEELGIPTYVTHNMPGVLCGYHLGLARSHTDLIEGAYLAEMLGYSAWRRQFARIANGVTRFGLTLGATKSVPILLPSLAEQQAIAQMLDSIDKAIEQGASRNANVTITESIRRRRPANGAGAGEAILEEPSVIATGSISSHFRRWGRSSTLGMRFCARGSCMRGQSAVRNFAEGPNWSGQSGVIGRFDFLTVLRGYPAR